MKAIALRAAAAIVLAASVHACSSESVTSPEVSERASLEQVLNEASNLDFMGVSSMVVLMPTPIFSIWPSAAPLSWSGCSHDAASRSFLCTTRTSGPLTFERSYTLYDAAGNTQAEFSRSTTAAVRTKMRVTGTLGTGSSLGTTTFDNVDDRTVSGLLTARHTLNGTSLSKSSGTFQVGPAATAYAMSSNDTTTIENLLLPSAANKWPGPGTVRIDGTSTFGTTPPSALHVLMRFTGTKCVLFSFEMDGFTESMTMDLSNPDARGCTP